MPKERLNTMDLHALLRRLQVGDSDRAIAQALHLDRKTVGKYHDWAQSEHLLEGELPDLATLHARLALAFPGAPLPQNQSSLELFRAEIQAYVDRGLRPRTIFQKLSEREDFTGSESAVYRLVQRLKPPKAPDAVGRVETPAGEVAQVDFGEVARMLDPRTHLLRRTWAFCLVLAFSRHMFVEFVFDQTVLTWLLCHQHAFEFFGGVPQRVVLDNLKAAIIRAYTRDEDAEVQRAYAECAEHYGFLIDPCLPAMPRHKGKVEKGGVGFVQSSFVPLLPDGVALPEANQRVLKWLMTTAGLREHGTTHVAPLTRFEQIERAALQPLPATAYDPAAWKRVTLYRDGYVVFEKSYYSAPTRLVGQTLWLRAGLREIRLFTEAYELVATHPRAAAPGTRQTQPDHLPAEKRAGLLATRATCQAQADAVGPAMAQVVAELLASRPVDKLRTALRVVQLAERYSAARAEAACARGLHYGDTRVPTLKRILSEGLEREEASTGTPPLPAGAAPVSEAPPGAPSGTPVYARSPEELAQALLGGAAWN